MQISVSISLLFVTVRSIAAIAFWPVLSWWGSYFTASLQLCHLETSLLPSQLFSIQHYVVLAQGSAVPCAKAMLGTSLRRVRKDVPQLLSPKPGLLWAEKQLCYLKIRSHWLWHPLSEALPGPSQGRYRQVLGGGPQMYQRQSECSSSTCPSASALAILSPWGSVVMLLP